MEEARGEVSVRSRQELGTERGGNFEGKSGKSEEEKED